MKPCFLAIDSQLGPAAILGTLGPRAQLQLLPTKMGPAQKYIQIPDQKVGPILDSSAFLFSGDSYLQYNTVHRAHC